MKEIAQLALLWLRRIEDGAITILVLVLVVLAGAQIVLRNFFETGLSWADPLLRALVLWSGMLGACAAVREDKHISLDVLSHFIKDSALRVVRILTLGFAAAICAVLAWFSGTLVKIDHETANIAFAAIPSWAVEIILPMTFGLMALRFALRACVLPAAPHAPIGVPEDLIENSP